MKYILFFSTLFFVFKLNSILSSSVPYIEKETTSFSSMWTNDDTVKKQAQEHSLPPSKPLTIYIRDSLYRVLKDILPLQLHNKKLRYYRRIEWIPVAGSTLYARLYFEGTDIPAHIVVGLEQHYTKNLKTFAFSEQLFTPLLLPVSWTRKDFIPLYYGYLTFLYNTEKISLPLSQTFENFLLNIKEYSLIIPHPSANMMGFSFVEWLFHFSEKNNLVRWSFLKSKIKSMPASWDFTYTLFCQQEADFILGYTTSLLAQNSYHSPSGIIFFSDGNPVHIFGAYQTLKGAKDPDTIQVINILLSLPIQNRIVQKMYMYPVITHAMTPELKILPKPEKILIFKENVPQKILEYWHTIFN